MKTFQYFFLKMKLFRKHKFLLANRSSKSADESCISSCQSSQKGLETLEILIKAQEFVTNNV